MHAVRDARGKVTVDASAVEDIDGAGFAMLVTARDIADEGSFAVTGLKANQQEIYNLYGRADLKSLPQPPADESVIMDLGRGALAVWADFRSQMIFLGSVVLLIPRAIANPRLVRWGDMLTTVEKAGIRALPVTILVGFLVGFILGFQGAIPLRMFQAEIFIPSLVSLVVLRELGPLMAALIFAGRSSSAFAAEIGTMKVNEEINALTTFGLDPVRFLVLSRMIAGILVMPVLAVFTNIAAILGGFLVFLSLGFPTTMFISQLQANLKGGDIYSGMVKTFVFGALVAAVGCLRGLQTKSGPTAVGDSTTSAVVSAIVLIVVADGVFAVIFFALGV